MMMSWVLGVQFITREDLQLGCYSTPNHRTNNRKYLIMGDIRLPYQNAEEQIKKMSKGSSRRIKTQELQRHSSDFILRKQVVMKRRNGFNPSLISLGSISIQMLTDLDN